MPGRHHFPYFQHHRDTSMGRSDAGSGVFRWVGTASVDVDTPEASTFSRGEIAVRGNRKRSALLAGAITFTTLAGAAVAGQATAATVPCGWLAGSEPPAIFDHVVWVIYENKSRKQIIGNPDAPYLTSIARQCGEATNWNHLSQTSLTNYIAMTSGSLGSNGEITTNQPPKVWPQSSVSLFEQLGTEARQLAETQPSNCYMKGSGDFVINHSPLQYYTRINATLCKTQAVALGSTPDLSAKFTLIVPNKTNDMHRTPENTTLSEKVRAGDTWTAGYLPKILASPEYQAGRTVVILAWDEGTQRDPLIPFIVVSPYVPVNTVVDTRYDHYALLKTTQNMLGITSYLGHAADSGTGNFRSDFHLE
jgi:phosphatidylinositol-3-phosphatase